MANEPYILKHTAEEIDDKLNLIAENKNLLPYPYEDTMPAGLTDVGDGSILTSASSASETKLLLNDCELPIGNKYIVSINITNILDEVISDSDFSLEVVTAGKEAITINDSAVLDLSQETTPVVTLVYLNIPDSFNTELLIKPQIEVQPINEDGTPSEEPTFWAPNMDKIGTYVDRRFNSLNTKFAEVIKKVNLLMSVSNFTEEQLNKMINFLDSIELE